MMQLYFDLRKKNLNYNICKQIQTQCYSEVILLVDIYKEIRGETDQ